MKGEYTLRTDDILKVIKEEGDSIAVIMLPGVQYRTGQVLDMKAIADAGHKKVNKTEIDKQSFYARVLFLL